MLIAYFSIYQNQVSAFCFFSCEREEAKSKIIEEYFTKCGDSYFFGFNTVEGFLGIYLVEFKDVTVVEIDGKPTEPTLADRLNQEEPKWIGFFKVQAGAHRMYDSTYTGPHFVKNYAELVEQGKWQQASEVPELEEWRRAQDTKTFITVSRWSKGWSKWKSGGLSNDDEYHFIATKYKDNSWKIQNNFVDFKLSGGCSIPDKATKSD